MTPGDCGATNTTGGDPWTYCPAPYGALAGGESYALRVFAETTGELGRFSSVVQVDLAGPGALRVELPPDAFGDDPAADDTADPAPVKRPYTKAPSEKTPKSVTTKAKIKVRTTKNGKRLRIDVNPDLPRGNYRVRAQKKRSNAGPKRWRTARTVKTKGRREVRKVAVGEGRYRFVLPKQRGLSRKVSRTIRIR